MKKKSMELREACREFVVGLIAGHDASHDISHIDRVVSNSVRIWSLSSDELNARVDLSIVVAIASLHDCFDHKYVTTDAAVDLVKAQVRSFLHDRCGFPPSIIEMVIEVIDNMGFTSEVSSSLGSPLSPTTLEYLHIVQDADRLDAIGAVGVSRCLAFSGAFGRPIITEDRVEELSLRKLYGEGKLRPSARKGPSAIAHFYDKLLFVKDMLKTPAGRALGEKRHAFIVSFLDNFFDETD